MNRTNPTTTTTKIQKQNESFQGLNFEHLPLKGRKNSGRIKNGSDLLRSSGGEIGLREMKAEAAWLAFHGDEEREESLLDATLNIFLSGFAFSFSLFFPAPRWDSSTQNKTMRHEKWGKIASDCVGHYWPIRDLWNSSLGFPHRCPRLMSEGYPSPTRFWSISPTLFWVAGCWIWVLGYLKKVPMLPAPTLVAPCTHK